MSALESEIIPATTYIATIDSDAAKPLNFSIETLKKADKFLDILGLTGGNVRRACQAAGLARPTVYQLQKADPEFARRWEEAMDGAVEELEYQARRRALRGINEPVFYQGEKCGTIKRYSDNLAMFLLKAHRPEKYRENIRIESELSPQSVEAIGNSLAQALIRAAEARRISQSAVLTDGE